MPLSVLLDGGNGSGLAGGVRCVYRRRCGGRPTRSLPTNQSTFCCKLNPHLDGQTSSKTKLQQAVPTCPPSTFSAFTVNLCCVLSQLRLELALIL